MSCRRGRTLCFSAQHAVLMSVYLVLIVIVFRDAGANHAATLNALSLGRGRRDDRIAFHRDDLQ